MNTGIYMVRVLTTKKDGTILKGDVTPARFTRHEWNWEDGPEVTEYWSFFGTEVTLNPEDIEIVVGPLF